MFKRKNKFNAVKTLAHGRLWSSKLELKVYEMLLMMERGGKFSEIKCQVHCRFKTEDHGKIIMIPDFSAVDLSIKRLVFLADELIFSQSAYVYIEFEMSATIIENCFK